MNPAEQAQNNQNFSAQYAEWLEKHEKKVKRIMRFFEFFLIGILMGIGEDLLAITFATGEPITLRVFIIAAVVAIPFAAFTELVVDKPSFRKKVEKIILKFIPDVLEGKTENRQK